MGRHDKGLFVTTGSFSNEAKKEAQREGAFPIDLLDRTDLALKLKELGLGLSVKKVDKVIVNEE